MYHRIGTPQESDVFVFATPDHPTWILGAQALSAGRWLWFRAMDGCVPANQAWVVDLDSLRRLPDGGIDFAAAGDGSEGAMLPCMPLIGVAACCRFCFVAEIHRLGFVAVFSALKQQEKYL